MKLKVGGRIKFTASQYMEKLLITLMATAVLFAGLIVGSLFIQHLR